MTAQSKLNQNEPEDLSGSGVANLIERCQDDLVLMESVLNQLEGRQDGDDLSNSLQSTDSSIAATTLHSENSRIALLGGDTIRRMANDIEDLYRTARVADVEAMLGNLQTKMVQSLRLLPAAKQIPRDNIACGSN